MAIATEDIHDAQSHSVFQKNWAELILEAPADLKRECAGWHHEFKRPGKRSEEFWASYYSFESMPRREM